jgi:hypothetical protein
MVMGRSTDTVTIFNQREYDISLDRFPGGGSYQPIILTLNE